jgi:hypothetical protein
MQVSASREGKAHNAMAWFVGKANNGIMAVASEGRILYTGPSPMQGGMSCGKSVAVRGTC